MLSHNYEKVARLYNSNILLLDNIKTHFLYYNIFLIHHAETTP